MTNRVKLILTSLGMTIALAGCGTHQSAATTVPLPENAQMMPVYTATKQEIQLNASIYPVLIDSLNHPHKLKKIAEQYNHLPTPKKPLMLILTGTNKTTVASDLKEAQQIINKYAIHLPWTLQIGPENLYTKTFPSILSITVKGQLRNYGGTKVITTNLPKLVKLTPPRQIILKTRATTKNKNSGKNNTLTKNKHVGGPHHG